MKFGEDNILMKNNMITRAKFNISTVENRVFQLVMYKLQKKGTGILECEISLDEFKNIIKHKQSLTPKGISEILTELRKQSIYFKKTKQEQQADQDAKKPVTVWGEWGIINGHEFNEATQCFTIEASEKLHSLLHDYLEGGYTPINLSVFFNLSNSYSQRFYDLLRLWSNSKNRINYSLDELRELLMLKDKYPRYVDLKRRVLTPAIEELNKTGMFDISIKENRRGRAVVSIDFIVSDLDKRKYFEKVEEEVPTPAEEEVPAPTDADIPADEQGGEEVPVQEDAPAEVQAPTETILPEENYLVKPLQRLVKIEFKGIDFSEGEYYMAFVESEVATQIQDNVEYITMAEWGYFKATLRNKVEALRSEQQAQEKAKTLEEQLLGWQNN